MIKQENEWMENPAEDSMENSTGNSPESPKEEPIGNRMESVMENLVEKSMGSPDETPIIATTWIGTANHGFAQYAIEELRRMFTGMKFAYLIPSEIFRFTVPESKTEVLQRIYRDEPMFLRHLQPVDVQLERSASEEPAVEIGRLWQVAAPLLEVASGTAVAVQVRKTEDAMFLLSPSEVKKLFDERMVAKAGVMPVVREADQIVSVFVTGEAIYLGVSRPEENISDWSGGAIRFRKEEGQISRAKFKLLEAEYAFGLDFSQYRAAIDLGAAPGGWTSLLLERGLQVTAIDPGALHPSLLRHPKLKYLRRNAANVQLEPNDYDLLVCDMSWNPKQTGKLLKELIDALQVGGTVILTVKLMHKKPFQTVKEVVKELEPELSLQRAKQLFHNREELTLFLIKNY